MPRKYDYDWKSLFQEQLSSGLNNTQFCATKNIPYPTYKRNVAKFRGSNETLKFYPVEFREEDKLQVSINGYSVSIDKTIDDVSLSRILKALSV